MTASNFPYCLHTILTWEGGFVNLPSDPGGATNLGITLATFLEWKPNGTVDDLKALTPSDPLVIQIYQTDYWSMVRCDDLPSGVDLICFDTAVNNGSHRAALWLQEACGVKADGMIGPVTLAAVAAHKASDLIDKIRAMRLAFIPGYVARTMLK